VWVGKELMSYTCCCFVTKPLCSALCLCAGAHGSGGRCASAALQLQAPETLGEAWDVEVTAFCIALPVCRVSGAAARSPASWVLPQQACLELRGLL